MILTNRLWFSFPSALFILQRFLNNRQCSVQGENLRIFSVKLVKCTQHCTHLDNLRPVAFPFSSIFLSYMSSLHFQGRLYSGGRDVRQTTLWWARGYERPFPPTSKWQTATTSAGTLEERWCERWDRDRHWGHVPSAVWGRPQWTRSPQAHSQI